MPALSRTTPLFLCALMLAACGGSASRPDGGAGSGGAGPGTGGAQATGGTVGSGGAAPGSGGTPGSGGAVGGGGAAQTGGRGGPGGIGGGQGGGHAGAGGGGRGGGAGQGGRGGQGGQAGDACAAAVAQATCTSEGTVCSFGCTDACHFCNLLRCQGGRWTPQEAFPAPCFMCGPTLSCQKNAQYCHETIGGPAGSIPSYQCRPTPTACLPTPTCSCLQAQSAISATTCRQSAAGELTVMTALP